MHTLHTRFLLVLAPICMLSRCSLTKISASELSRKFIKSALLVGCPTNVGDLGAASAYAHGGGTAGGGTDTWMLPRRYLDNIGRVLGSCTYVLGRGAGAYKTAAIKLAHSDMGK